MKRSIAMTVLLGAVACGSGSESTAPVSAGAPPESRRLVEEEPGTWTQSATPPESAEDSTPVHPSVTSCLGLVRESRWAEAVAPCTDALRNAPGNREVADALAKAKQEVAAQATAKASSAAQAVGGASDAAEGGTSSLLEKGEGSIPTGLR